MKHKLSTALATTALLALGAGASYGQAAPGSFEFEETFSDTVTNYPCSGGAPVTMTGTSIQKGHFTEVDERHFNVSGSNSIEYRADYPDGRFALGFETDHFSFSLNARRPVSSDMSAQQEDALLYTADGTLIGKITVRVIHHETFMDENGDFQVDPGELTSSVHRIRIRCP
jgi:hypothetical protein